MARPPRNLQELLDIEAIKQLKSRYVRLLDGRRWQDFQALFTDDATFVSPSSMGEAVDVTAFVERVRSNPIVRGSVHMACLPEITISGDDSATGVWRMLSVHPPEDFTARWGQLVPEGVPYEEEYLHLLGTMFSRQSIVFHGYGYYVDEYRKVADEWKIASIRQAHVRRDAIPATVLRMLEADATA